MIANLVKAQSFAGAIHKRCLLKGGGSKILEFTKGEGGGHEIGKMGRHCLWMAP